MVRFVPSLAGTEMGRVQKFIHGLHPVIYKDVMTEADPLQRFSDALGRALRSEAGLQKMGAMSRASERDQRMEDRDKGKRPMSAKRSARGFQSQRQRVTP